MRIIPLFESEETLIKKAINGNAVAEKKIFDKYAPKMLGLCRNYISDLHYAEDVMICGFTKVFDHLHKYRNEGSFEGWIRKIMVREAIDFIRSRKKINFSSVEEIENIAESRIEMQWDFEKIEQLINELPNGYRTVLLMYAVDDFSHKEIAESLQISESTSKSQLFKARKMLQELLNPKSENTAQS